MLKTKYMPKPKPTCHKTSIDVSNVNTKQWVYDHKIWHRDGRSVLGWRLSRPFLLNTGTPRISAGLFTSAVTVYIFIGVGLTLWNALSVIHRGPTVLY